jgi:hypothetical protein
VTDLLDELRDLESADRRTQNRADRIPVMFASKFWNDADGREPTDENLAAIFAGCVRPPEAKWYPAIRAAIANRPGEATS